MRINADFSQRAVVRPADYVWVDSPMPGVERMMLDRVGDELARATSLVRYAPRSRFSAHVHGGGEEFLVLAGVFADEHAEYPVGTYVRNPIGTAHTPRIGAEGCTIFVKLMQFDKDDVSSVTKRSDTDVWNVLAAGVEVQPLHRFGNENVQLFKLAADAVLPTPEVTGLEELFVIEGGLSDAAGAYAAGTWIRNPAGTRSAIAAGGSGALVYRKTGHTAE